jgi:hypothetical protein
VPCEKYLDGMQRPMNYCSGMRASNEDAKMKTKLYELLARLPTRPPRISTSTTANPGARCYWCPTLTDPYRGHARTIFAETRSAYRLASDGAVEIEVLSAGHRDLV